jgi:hypothetical protein
MLKMKNKEEKEGVSRASSTHRPWVQSPRQKRKE